MNTMRLKILDNFLNKEVSMQLLCILKTLFFFFRTDIFDSAREVFFSRTL